MGIEPKLTGNENDIYKHILNQDSTERAKNFTKAGGSLGKLRGVAEKVLNDPSIEKGLKEKVYANLKEAVEGKRLYYQNTKMGKITSFLKNTPGISKFFGDPIKTTEDKMAAYSRQAESLQNRELAERMKSHYMAQINQQIERLKGQREMIGESLSHLGNGSTPWYLANEKFAKALSNDLFNIGTRRDRIKNAREEYIKAAPEQKSDKAEALSLAATIVQNELFTKSHHLEKYAEKLAKENKFSSERSKEIGSELQEILGEDGTIELFKEKQKPSIDWESHFTEVNSQVEQEARAEVKEGALKAEDQASAKPFTLLENRRVGFYQSDTLAYHPPQAPEAKKAIHNMIEQLNKEEMTLVFSSKRLISKELTENLERADLSLLNDKDMDKKVDLRDVAQNMPNLKTLELDVNKIHDHWDSLLTMPKLQTVILKGQGQDLILKLQGTKEDKANQLADILTKAEAKFPRNKDFDTKISYLNSAIDLAISSKTSDPHYLELNSKRQRLRLELNLKASHFKEAEMDLNTAVKEIGVEPKEPVTFRNLHTYIRDGIDSYPAFIMILDNLPIDGADEANGYFYRGMAEKITVLTEKRETDEALRDIDYFLKNQTEPSIANMSNYPKEWNTILASLATLKQNGAEVDKQILRLKNLVKDQDSSIWAAFDGGSEIQKQLHLLKIIE